MHCHDSAQPSMGSCRVSWDINRHAVQCVSHEAMVRKAYSFSRAIRPIGQRWSPFS